jgi:hypothetical protein
VVGRFIVNPVHNDISDWTRVSESGRGHCDKYWYNCDHSI